ncbi:hypothetical protein Scep_016920 [Stephania cephalantha]|uniref:Uncharacterized protein n=1 Tax=Stephania cephalantha TaxID=152367 RepID=A0AAP0INQ5_9MAGN
MKKNKSEEFWSYFDDISRSTCCSVALAKVGPASGHGKSRMIDKCVGAVKLKKITKCG